MSLSELPTDCDVIDIMCGDDDAECTALSAWYIIVAPGPDAAALVGTTTIAIIVLAEGDCSRPAMTRLWADAVAFGGGQRGAARGEW